MAEARRSHCVWTIHALASASLRKSKLSVRSNHLDANALILLRDYTIHSTQHVLSYATSSGAMHLLYVSNDV